MKKQITIDLPDDKADFVKWLSNYDSRTVEETLIDLALLQISETMDVFIIDGIYKPKKSRGRYTDLPSDCKQAIAELKRMKVYKVMNHDAYESFSDVWYRVQHEVDMYREGEADELTQISCVNAMVWLDRYKDLYEKYK